MRDYIRTLRPYRNKKTVVITPGKKLEWLLENINLKDYSCILITKQKLIYDLVKHGVPMKEFKYWWSGIAQKDPGERCFCNEICLLNKADAWKTEKN